MIRKDQHKGETILVLGGGPSVDDFNVCDLQRYTTIGVNQISRRMDPTYVTLIDTCKAMGEGIPFCMRSLEKSIVVTAEANLRGWSNLLPANLRHKQDINVIKRFEPNMDWEAWELSDYEDAERDWGDTLWDLPYFGNSAGIACWLAAYMGAARIGLIGIDLGPDYFFPSVKPFAVHPDKESQEAENWEDLAAMIHKVTGTEVYNLSRRSLVDGIPKAELVRWLMETGR
jgi:hypothetical protein